MKQLQKLFENNRSWSAEQVVEDPEFFRRLAAQQSPEYLWIGCSDSRVPANEIVGLLPGELFVHRNVSNVVSHFDLNCLSVIQYAVEVLRVRHIIVTGHYGCGGVLAALTNRHLGLIDNWLRQVQDVYHSHRDIIDVLPTEQLRADLLCELNVIEQVYNVCRSTVVQQAWESGQLLTVHGWIYGIEDGLLHDLDVCLSGCEEMESGYQVAIEGLGKVRGRAEKL